VLTCVNARRRRTKGAQLNSSGSVGITILHHGLRLDLGVALLHRRSGHPLIGALDRG
jgi:hypothetical protein